jgi:hypothetical protein
MEISLWLAYNCVGRPLKKQSRWQLHRLKLRQRLKKLRKVARRRCNDYKILHIHTVFHLLGVTH